MSRKTIFLTIDDSPSSEMAEKLEFLNERGIRAIWCCRGQYLKKNPKPVLQAIQSGHIIANHSFSHPHFSSISKRRIIFEILRTEKLINALYLKTGIRRPYKFFRFPYGDKGTGLNPFLIPFRILSPKFIRCQSILAKYRFEKFSHPGLRFSLPYGLLLRDRDLFWTFDLRDWEICQNTNDAKEQTRLALENTKEMEKHRGAEILIMHDFDSNTRMFCDIIQYLLNHDADFLIPPY